MYGMHALYDNAIYRSLGIIRREIFLSEANNDEN